jgi:arylsulfatase
MLTVSLAIALGGLPAGASRPNIVFIIADDLGYGDLGCYGQQKIRTPNLDRLAKEGMRFTQGYSGHNVCAPSRCVLMTGKHPGHAFVRDNRQAPGFPEGQTPVPAGELTLPLALKAAGYTLGGFGKWGLGPVGSTGEPHKQGFDRWFGYNCQAIAHNYYPTHLWDDSRRIALANPKFAANQKLPADKDANDAASFAPYAGKDYAPDLIAKQAREFVRSNRDRPFFLYFATTVPHLALQVPEDSLAEYAGKFPETPYRGERGYLPHRQPRAAYAAMVTRMDREVGALLATVSEVGAAERTIVVFTSDNGPLYDQHGGTDSEFFHSAAGLRGRKGSYYEGGFRVPYIVKAPGRTKPGSTSDRVVGFEDWLPTLFELAGMGEKSPPAIDGISFAPTLSGERQAPRPFLYREAPSYGGQQCIRIGDWKAIRTNLNPGPSAKNQNPGSFELYDLANDPQEKRNLADERPEIIAKLAAVMKVQHHPSTLFPIKALDAAGAR